jgi:hypothetical protein
MSSLLRRMRKLSKRFCAAALFGIVQGPLHGQHDACRFSEWGYSYYSVEQQGEAWTYLLTASGPNWLNKPYGYHAPGFLVCDKCASAGNAWGGVYDFSARVDLRPPTAAERAQRRKEWIGGYPNTQLGPEHIEHFGLREGIALGPLTGYAVLYRFLAKAGRDTFAEVLAARDAGLLVVHLSDGCVSFETTILLQSNDRRDAWAALKSLLADVTIEKSRGARVGPRPPPGGGYSAVVRPPRKID